MDADRTFFDKLLKLGDAALQSQKLYQWLNAGPAAQVVSDLENALRLAIRGNQAMRELLNPYLLTNAIFELLSLEKREELFQQTRLDRLHLSTGLFADLLPQKLEPPLATFRISDVRPERKDRKDTITLGERRALGKSGNLKVLEKLIYDPDERVIENLLNNLHIMEKHVLLICSRQPNRSAILQTISCHPKWGRNPRIRLALIQNPYTPPLLATLGLITAQAGELLEIARVETLHPVIRDMAKFILAERGG